MTSPLATLHLTSAGPDGQCLFPLQSTDIWKMSASGPSPSSIWLLGRMGLIGRRCEDLGTLASLACGEAGPATVSRHKPEGPGIDLWGLL